MGLQAKYRAEESLRLGWDELSTFAGLAFGACQGIVYGLICTTCERITEVMHSLQSVGFLARDTWNDLDAGFFQATQQLIEHTTIRRKPLEPRPHQRRAVSKAISHFVEAGNRRGKLIWPCGTGKSLTACWIADALEAEKVLVVVPSLALIRQSLNVWLYQVCCRRKGSQLDLRL